MKVSINPNPKYSNKTHLFVLLTEGSSEPLNLPDDVTDVIRDTVDRSEFAGRCDESLTLLADKPTKITLIGLGKAGKLTHRSARAGLFKVGSIARSQRSTNVAILFPYTLPHLDERGTTLWIADQLQQSDYRYDRYLSDDDSNPLEISATLIPPASIDAKQAKKLATEASIISDAVELAKDLGNGPGNLITPEAIADKAQEMAAETGLTCKVYDLKQIRRMKMGGLLAVNQGSAKEPRFIVLEHKPRKRGKTICLVGKGITFDSGGISIKPSSKMEEMKFDMCGAAAVIGIMQAVALLDIPHHVVGLVPSTENLPGGNAYKPGDIITTMSGTTVEIVNTDAEGRMILCDALTKAAEYEPDHMIDFATLTGACVIALGAEASGLFSNDDELAQKLIQAGDEVGERLWRMPEWDDYRELITSEWADIKNSGGRSAGAISAAMFLKEFVEVDSWAHLDIAGTAWAESANQRERKGATGSGVRATVRFLQGL